MLVFDYFYCGLLYDTMHFDFGMGNFMLCTDIKPVFDIDYPVYGPAFTCKGEAVYQESDIKDHIRIEMFEHFTQGCVQVIDGSYNPYVAHFGDISGSLARKYGAAGAVIDGYTRDIIQLKKNDFPVACCGARVEDAYGKWQITDYQVPIDIAGTFDLVTVNPGDLIFFDMDGVLVIPKDAVNDVAEKAYKRLLAEDEVRTRLYNSDPMDLYKELGRW